jgi:hypothetical protein
MTFEPLSGLISGTPQEAGVFDLVIGASNSGGADSKALVLTSFPVIANQVLSKPYQQPMSYAVVSSESGAGVHWSATGLPQNLSINAATGVISGTPKTPGVYPIALTVTTRGASSQATLTLTVTGIPPVITQNPVASRSLQFGTTTTLSVAATGLPDPEFQWYEGPSGNTDAPVLGATSPVFTTPPLATNTRYWARASSISGTADSTATVITILPSTNANLIGLYTSEGAVSPSFNFGVTAYSLAVPNEASAIQLTPIVEVTQSTVKINGVPVPLDSASDPVALAVGNNVVNIDVTAGNGSATKRYTLTVTRSQPASVTTTPATGVTASTAILHGNATPNGPGTVFFQYGKTNAYGNATPGQEVSGTSSLAIQATLSGLSPEVIYHYRIGITTGAGTIFGSDMSFTTPKAPPLVATGQAIDVASGSVKFIGAVDPNGTATSVHFEYGTTTIYGQSTPIQPILASDGVLDIESTVTGLTPGTVYHYRLVGTSTAGNAFGEDVAFIAGQASIGTGIPTAVPDAVTQDALNITGSSAFLQGTANPQGGTTFVSFEYGLTTAYGNATTARGIGSGTDAAVVLQQVSGLQAGLSYHFRLVATNSLGTSYGEDRTFSTGFLAPLATTGAATPLVAGGVHLAGTVRARGASADVFFEYGTDGVSFPNRVQADEAAVTGDTEVNVGVNLTNLPTSTIYYYRTVAIRSADPSSIGTGAPKTFQGEALAGLFQKFPRELDASEYRGEVQVNLLPVGIGKWRFVGEIDWRSSGGVAAGLTSGDREIEFLGTPGYLQPGREPVGVISGSPRLVLEREYFPSASPSDSSLQVILYPENRRTATPTSQRVQWRLAGGDSWKDSGTLLTGMAPGSYLVDFKAVQGLNAPATATVVLGRGETTTASFAYVPDLDAPSSSIRVLSFNTISTSRNLPYAYVGQLRTDKGSYSGFVAKPRVVATVAQSIFDEVTLAQIPGVQWIFQHDREVHEPKPMVPRGFYIYDSYASQRGAENTPGSMTLTAQQYNSAALYFLGDAGRGGYSGFLSTDETNKPLATSATLKMVTGFPVRGGNSTSNYGRMQSMRPDDEGLVAVTPSIFGTTDFKGLTGMIGGPLSIQRDGGSYFPAGIYLGGSNEQNLYRAIDSGVIDLIGRAEETANTGNNNTSGGISLTSYTAVSTTSTKGSLTVILEPAEARAAGAAWKLGTDSTYLLSAARKNNMSPGDYILQIKAIPGFQTPVQQTVSVLANNLTTVTFTYLSELSLLSTWRADNFGATDNTGSAADGQDPDGDGTTNLDEYTAGTDPNDPHDVFRVSTITRAGNTETDVIPRKTGRIYSLQRRADLGTGAWENVVTVGPPAANGNLTLTDSAATGDRWFYQATVELASP